MHGLLVKVNLAPYEAEDLAEAAAGLCGQLE